MTTPEDFLAENNRVEVRAAELRGKIVRAERWEQLFTSPEEAQGDFQRNLVDNWRFYYRKDDCLAQYSVEPYPEGDIHRVIMDKGHDTTYQRLLNGDVIFTIYSPDKPPSVNLITPGIGNINHSFTNTDVVLPEGDVIEPILKELDSRQDSFHFGFLFTHLKGKPATQDWEDTMLHNGYLPQRIGHRLFPGYALAEVAMLREEYPQLVVKPF